MKLNKLIAAALLLVSGAASAQTDVTSTYLMNADFSEGPVITADICGYGKDIAAGSGDVYGFQDVTGWTYVVTKGDNSKADYPNSAMGGGVLAYGSTNQLKGSNVAAPAAGPDAGSTNGLGFFAVWGCGGYYYQDVTLAAGKYTITFPIYCISGTQANTTYTGFFPTSGTNRTVAINTTVGSWVNQTVEFTLAAETAGQIRLGYQSTGSGSGANPHLVFDGVKIEYTATVVKDVLQNAITAATAANNVLEDSGLATAITTAQGVYNNDSATQEQVNTAAAALNAAVEVAMDGKDVTAIFVENADFASLDGWTLLASDDYHDQGSYPIGGESNVRFASPTADDTHLSSEYALGFECRWQTNFTSYYQTTEPVPAGVYTLTFDVENVNGSTKGQTYNNLFYAQVGDTKYTDSSTEWMKGKSSWTTHTITVTINEAAPLTISLGYGTGNNNTGADFTPAIYVSHLSLTYSSFLAGAMQAWQEAGTAAAAAMAANTNVTGSEKAALVAACSATPEATVEGYNAAAETITAATAALVAAAPSYNAHAAEIAYAKTIGVDTEAAEAAAANSEMTAATIVAATQELKVLEYTTITAAYSNDASSLLGTWGKGNYDTTNGQGYVSDESYFDKWSGSATDLTSSATVTLPAGKYVVKVAGRGVSTTTMNLSVKVGEADAVSTPFLLIGDTGKGIDTAGDTNFSEDGTYSNGNAGRGWQYRYITFETTGEEVTIAISGHLNAGTWQSFYAPVLLCDDDTWAPIALDAAKAKLQAAIDAAPAAITANIGDEVFQLEQTVVDAYAAALATAQDAHDAEDATLTSIDDALTALDEAITTYNAAELNAPADGQLFNIVLTYEGWTYDKKAVTYIAGGRSDAGYYNIQYKAEANQNLAQAFTFTKVDDEVNTYYLSQIDADGNVRYISTGIPYDGNTSQIRTVTDVANALKVEVRATSTEGVYNLYNTEASQYIGSQDAGFFTVNSHIDFFIQETAKPSVEVNPTGAEYSTIMLPFAAAVPEGLEAYSIESVNEDGKTLVLTAVEDGLKANKPYVLYGTGSATLEGDAQGVELTYTDGLLTGTYADITAPAASYVLQNQDDVIAFYVVEKGSEPAVKANHAYLTVASASVKAFTFGQLATAVESARIAAAEAQGTIFNIAGQRVSRAQKGIYVVGGKKVVRK